MIKHLGRDLGQQFMWHVVNYSNYKAVWKFSASVFKCLGTAFRQEVVIFMSKTSVTGLPFFFFLTFQIT